jgi:hypothetical protein
LLEQEQRTAKDAADGTAKVLEAARKEKDEVRYTTFARFAQQLRVVVLKGRCQ